MHENLKFNLLPKSNEWQPIVAAQLHGTFFGIFMKFENWKVDSKNHSCSFYIQNFRGAISMGLNVGEILVNPDDLDENHYFRMRLDVIPFSSKKFLLNCNINFKEKLKQKDLLDVEYGVGSIPNNIYNPDNLKDSLYIDPYKYYRDGECYIPLIFDHHNKECEEDGKEDLYSDELYMHKPGGICDMTISKIIIA